MSNHTAEHATWHVVMPFSDGRCHLTDLSEPYTLPALRAPAPAPAADQHLKCALVALDVVAALALSEVRPVLMWLPLT